MTNWLRVLFLIVFTASYSQCFSQSNSAMGNAKTEPLSVASSSVITPLRVTYPASDSNPYYYKRVKYFVEVLDLALAKSGEPYRLEKVNLPFMNEDRSMHNLMQGVYDVHWLNSLGKRDERLIPIRIPLCKGLIGWRILFIREGDQQRFSNIKTLDELKQLTAGNGLDWPDTLLFDQLHFTQRTSPSWEALFLMLNRHRIDYLSRSVLEVWDEQNAFPNLHLTMESDLLLRYPAAYYFYVSKKNQKLADAIEKGLNRAIADGSFDKLFQKYFAERLQKLNLAKRRQLIIPGSVLPAGAGLDRAELWYDLPK